MDKDVSDAMKAKEKPPISAETGGETGRQIEETNAAILARSWSRHALIAAFVGYVTVR